jgi:hypothetical protein
MTTIFMIYPSVVGDSKLEPSRKISADSRDNVNTEAVGLVQPKSASAARAPRGGKARLGALLTFTA